MPILPKEIHRVNAVSIKISIAFFTETKQLIYMEAQKAPNSQ
jgi:hypothetical protein